MSIQLIKEFEKKFTSKNKLNFNIGDTVKVHTKIVEGEKERTQVFLGIVIAIKNEGLSTTFTVYRSAYGVSMERVFLLNSPRVLKIQVEKKGKVRRSKLYYLRSKSGKKAKVKGQLFTKEREEAVQDELAQMPESIEAKEEVKETKAPAKEKKEEDKEKEATKETKEPEAKIEKEAKEKKKEEPKKEAKEPKAEKPKEENKEDKPKDDKKKEEDK